MSCYISCMKSFQMSFEEIDNIELELLLELIATQNKIEESLLPENEIKSIDEVLPI